MHMISLAIFFAAAFLGGVTTGLSGFAMGLVVSGIWLHLITPSQNALLIVLCGIVTQAVGIWRIRQVIRWKAVVPLVLGSALGVAIGTALLSTVDQRLVRLSIGVLLIVLSLYFLVRPKIATPAGGVPVEIGVGVVNGVVGGLTGLGGIVLTVWSQLRGGNKDAQRAIFQPASFATFLISAVSFGFVGSYTLETMKLYLLALPALVVGVMCGIWLYGRLDDAAFRRVVLVLLFGSGLSLVVPPLLRAAGIWSS
ncbi:MAG TPA: sulfite exporter TauE/SafE family protein [Pseudolabrys sp.]|nr:sulfite exporter TauE/SafE family protein [Pseudolabrys sp.]